MLDNCQGFGRINKLYLEGVNGAASAAPRVNYSDELKEKKPMPMSEEVTVTCSKCGKEGPFTIWPSLNMAADLYPEKKARSLG